MGSYKKRAIKWGERKTSDFVGEFENSFCLGRNSKRSLSKDNVVSEEMKNSCFPRGNKITLSGET